MRSFPAICAWLIVLRVALDLALIAWKTGAPHSVASLRRYQQLVNTIGGEFF